MSAKLLYGDRIERVVLMDVDRERIEGDCEFLRLCAIVRLRALHLVGLHLATDRYP
jgi:hypothetical protein